MKQLRSPPNIITVSRIASAPLLSYLIVTNQHDAALFGCVLAGFSDVLDGYLAKQHNMATVLGTYLDPLADKILINVLSVSLWWNGTLPTPLVALWMVRDVALTAGAYLYVARNTASGMTVTDPLTTPLKINPTVTSKINTAFQFATLSVGILYPLYPVLSDGLTALCWITGATTCASGFSYLGYSAFSKSGNEKQESERNNNTTDR
jgi:cardiolipin synthase